MRLLVALVFVLPLADSGSMKLIEVQNKVAGLQELRRFKFVIPQPMAEQLAAEQEEALSLVRGGMAEGLAPVDAALADLKRANDAKNLEARKLIQKTAERVWKDTVKVDELMGKWDRAHLNRERAISTAIPFLAKDIDALAMADKNIGGSLIQRLAITYGGPKRHAVGTHDEFVKLVVQLEQQEDGLRARLEMLSRLKKWMDAYEFLKDPQDWLLKQIDKYTVEFLAAGYDDDSKKFLTSMFTTVRESVAGVAKQWTAIDQSVVDVPESTRTMCKAFAVAGGFVKILLGGVKALGLEGPFQAVFEAIGYYVDAFETVWKTAEVLGKIFDKQRQDIAGEIGTDLENKLRDEQGELYRDPDAAAFGVRLLHNNRGDYFLLTGAKEYEKITKAQRDSLVQAMADERIVNGFYEASEGWWSWTGQKISNAFEFMKTLGQADLKENEREAYEARLVGVSRRTLIDAKSLSSMAAGSSGYFSLIGKRKSVSCADLADQRAKMLEGLGRDQFIREAMAAPWSKPEWTKAYLDFWIEVVKSDVMFSRGELQKLFRGYVERPDAAKLASALKRERERRVTDHLEISVPYVGSGPRDELPAGGTADLEADFVIAGLPPGESVEATVTWTAPAWAKIDAKKIKLENGVQSVRCKVTVPETERGKKPVFRVRVQAGEVPGEGQVELAVTDAPPLVLRLYQMGDPTKWFTGFTARLWVDDDYLKTEKPGTPEYRAKDDLCMNQKEELQRIIRRTKAQWAKMTVRVGKKSYTIYGRISWAQDRCVLFGVGVPLDGPGTHKVSCSVSALGSVATLDVNVKVEVPERDRTDAEQRVQWGKERYEKAKEAWVADHIGDAYDTLAQPALAMQYWKEAVDLGDAGAESLMIAWLKYGRIDETVALAAEKNVAAPDSFMMWAYVFHRDDRANAWTWYRKMMDRAFQGKDVQQYRTFPIEGEPVLE